MEGHLQSMEIPLRIMKNITFSSISGYTPIIFIYVCRFTESHNYEKPNDDRGLGLMNECAVNVMKEFSDVIISYGESDEYRLS